MEFWSQDGEIGERDGLDIRESSGNMQGIRIIPVSVERVKSRSTSTTSNLDAVRKESKSTGDRQLIQDCPKCGRNHPERCPAFTRNCLKCGLRRHFASKCKNSEAQVQEMMMQEKQPTEMFVSALGGSKSHVWSVFEN